MYLKVIKRAYLKTYHCKGKNLTRFTLLSISQYIHISHVVRMTLWLASPRAVWNLRCRLVVRELVTSKNLLGMSVPPLPEAQELSHGEMWQ